LLLQPENPKAHNFEVTALPSKAKLAKVSKQTLHVAW
jgi:hypothetical protein